MGEILQERKETKDGEVGMNDDEICYVCKELGDDYSIDENGEPICNCERCSLNPNRPEDE